MYSPRSAHPATPTFQARIVDTNAWNPSLGDEVSPLQQGYVATGVYASPAEYIGNAGYRPNHSLPSIQGDDSSHYHRHSSDSCLIGSSQGPMATAWHDYPAYTGHCDPNLTNQDSLITEPSNGFHASSASTQPMNVLGPPLLVDKTVARAAAGHRRVRSSPLNALPRGRYPTNLGLPDGRGQPSMSAGALASSHIRPLDGFYPSNSSLNFKKRPARRSLTPQKTFASSPKEQFPTPESVNCAVFEATQLVPTNPVWLAPPSVHSLSPSARSFSPSPASSPRQPTLPLYPATIPASLAQASPSVGSSSYIESDGLLDRHSVLTSNAATLWTLLSKSQQFLDSRLVDNAEKCQEKTHFWFDVRSIKSWDDFSVSGLCSAPSIAHPLRRLCDAQQTPLPSTAGQSAWQVLRCYSFNLCERVNTALALAQAQVQIFVAPDGFSTQFHADLVTLSTTSQEYTPTGECGGRVIGILKPSSVWSSDMRSGNKVRLKQYLTGLSDVHQAMRDHSCRYGYILTDQELVCVRYSVPRGQLIPEFGSLEVATAVKMSAVNEPACPPGRGATMTAASALFLLNMLARDEAMTRDTHWKLEVGHPRDATRLKSYRLNRDAGMPDILQFDKRTAVRVRGWWEPKQKITLRERNFGKVATLTRKRKGVSKADVNPTKRCRK